MTAALCRGGARSAAAPRTRTASVRASVAKRGFEQSVLVVEVVRHESRRNTGAPRDLCESRADIADFGETVDRDLHSCTRRASSLHPAGEEPL